MAELELRSVSKTYQGGTVGLSGVDLTVDHGEVLAILGPSGSGKSTLLRLIAGLESVDSGSIWLGGRRIDRIVARDRGVAMVFQDQVVYPHLDVFENIAFGLRARKTPEQEVEYRVGATAAVLGLGECLRRKPATLSGGQRRRVALGRAMVSEPRLFLFDEPFSGLDAPLRASTRAEFIQLRRRLGATILLVTHDQAEALALGDRVAIIDRGRIVQVGPPEQVYGRPADLFVARFVGQPTIRLLPCLAAREGSNLSLRIVDLDDLGPWTFPPSVPWASALLGRGEARVDLGLRPEDISVGIDRTSLTPGGPAFVSRLEPAGHEIVAELGFGPHALAARFPVGDPVRVGDRLDIGFNLDRASWFDPRTGGRIGS